MTTLMRICRSHQLIQWTFRVFEVGSREPTSYSNESRSSSSCISHIVAPFTADVWCHSLL